MNWRNFSRALLGVAGVGLLLFPASLSRAQTPTTPAAKDEKKIERKDKKVTQEEREAELRSAREAVERIQKEMQKLQEQMHKRAEDMQKAMQRLHQLEGGPGGGFTPGRFRPDAGPGGFPGGPPGGFPGGGPGWGGPPQGSNMDLRLQQVEQKLDMILKELRDLRGEKNQAPKGGKKGSTAPSSKPGATPPPNAPGAVSDPTLPVPNPPRPPISDPSRP